MEFIQIFILSIVQGITEFLPISSSAHLILMPKLFGWADQGIVFDIAVHLGTLFAVLIYFKHETFILLRAMADIITGAYNTNEAKLAWKLVIATIPLLVFALFVKDFVETGGRHFAVLGITSIVFGLLLWWADRMPEKNTTKKNIEKILLKDAAIFGVFQALAIIPGTSRSGICMTAGRFIGCNRQTSSHFATLMAIPTIMIIFLYSITKIDGALFNWAEDWHVLGLGIVLSFCVALGAIHILMTWVSRVGYWPFVIYRVLLGSILLVFAFL